MGLFKKKEKVIYPKQTYRIFMTHTGKLKDPVIEEPVVTDDSEFLAIRVAEKQFPHLKVAKVEKIGEVMPENDQK